MRALQRTVQAPARRAPLSQGDSGADGLTAVDVIRLTIQKVSDTGPSAEPRVVTTPGDYLKGLEEVKEEIADELDDINVLETLSDLPATIKEKVEDVEEGLEEFIEEEHDDFEPETTAHEMMEEIEVLENIELIDKLDGDEDVPEERRK